VKDQEKYLQIDDGFLGFVGEMERKTKNPSFNLRERERERESNKYNTLEKNNEKAGRTSASSPLTSVWFCFIFHALESSTCGPTDVGPLIHDQDRPFVGAIKEFGFPRLVARAH
jgi:hypothetical protein